MAGMCDYIIYGQNEKHLHQGSLEMNLQGNVFRKNEQ